MIRYKLYEKLNQTRREKYNRENELTSLDIKDSNEAASKSMYAKHSRGVLWDTDFPTFREFILKRYEPHRPMTEWLTNKTYKDVSRELAKYGPNTNFRNVIKSLGRPPNMDDADLKDFM